jgi:hypothetical protein
MMITREQLTQVVEAFLHGAKQTKPNPVRARVTVLADGTQIVRVPTTGTAYLCATHRNREIVRNH